MRHSAIGHLDAFGNRKSVKKKDMVRRDLLSLQRFLRIFPHEGEVVASIGTSWHYRNKLVT